MGNIREVVIDCRVNEYTKSGCPSEPCLVKGCLCCEPLAAACPVRAGTSSGFSRISGIYLGLDTNTVSHSHDELVGTHAIG